MQLLRVYGLTKKVDEEDEASHAMTVPEVVTGAVTRLHVKRKYEVEKNIDSHTPGVQSSSLPRNMG